MDLILWVNRPAKFGRCVPLEEAVNMSVSGFCKDGFRELPMEFAVEAQTLLGVSLEGSVG